MINIGLSVMICVLLFTLTFCNPFANNDYLLDSVGKEWRLDEMNNKKIVYEWNSLFIVFYQDYTYELYSKRDGRKFNTPTDNFFTKKWYFDKEKNLFITSFSILDFELISLSDSELVFRYGDDKYYFVCDDCNDKFD